MSYHVHRGDLEGRLVDDKVFAQTALRVVVGHVALEVVYDVSFGSAVFFDRLPAVAALRTAPVVVQLLDRHVLACDRLHALLAVEALLAAEATLAVQQTVGLPVVAPVLLPAQRFLALAAGEVRLVVVLLLAAHDLLVGDRLFAPEALLLVVLAVALLAEEVAVLLVEAVGRQVEF